MRALTLALLAALLVTGCFVVTRDRRSHTRSRSCPPAYHWEDGGCVHNGKAKGHHKHKKHKKYKH